MRQHRHEPSCALFYRGPHLAGGWEQLPGPTALSHRPVVWHLAQPQHEHPAASPPAAGLTSPACGGPFAERRVFAFHLLVCFNRGQSRRRRAHGFLPSSCAAAPGRASRPVPGPQPSGRRGAATAVAKGAGRALEPWLWHGQGRIRPRSHGSVGAGWAQRCDPGTTAAPAAPAPAPRARASDGVLGVFSPEQDERSPGVTWGQDGARGGNIVRVRQAARVGGREGAGGVQHPGAEPAATSASHRGHGRSRRACLHERLWGHRGMERSIPSSLTASPCRCVA